MVTLITATMRIDTAETLHMLNIRTKNTRDAKDLVIMKADATSMSTITVDMRTMRTKFRKTIRILRKTQLITEISLKSLLRRETKAKRMRSSSFHGMVRILSAHRVLSLLSAWPSELGSSRSRINLLEKVMIFTSTSTIGYSSYFLIIIHYTYQATP